MNKSYFLVDTTGVERGPIDYKLIAEYGINPKTMVWFSGLPVWVKAGSVPELSNHTKQTGIESKEGLPELDQTDEFHKKILLLKINDNDKNCSISESTPRTWLAESILATIFCFLPFGVIGIINAVRVKKLWEKGKYVESLESSQKAAWWTKWSFIIAFTLWLIWIVISILLPTSFNTVEFFNNYFML